MIAEEDCVATLRRKRTEFSRDYEPDKKAKVSSEDDEKVNRESESLDAAAEEKDAIILDCVFTDLGPLLDLHEFSEKKLLGS